jgi:preprotein translocase subunit YajC
VTSATGVQIGDYVYGTGIGYKAKVTNIATNTITVDVANTGTVSGITVNLRNFRNHSILTAQAKS